VTVAFLDRVQIFLLTYLRRKNFITDVSLHKEVSVTFWKSCGSGLRIRTVDSPWLRCFIRLSLFHRQIFSWKTLIVLNIC